MSMSSTQENLYAQRINAVIDHVREHLNDDLSLDTLARVAGFSPSHFYRLCKSISDTAWQCPMSHAVKTRLLCRKPLLLLVPKRNDTDECILPIHQQVEDLLRLIALMILFQLLRIDR
jgi:AraC-like DNA-binding protein